MPKILFLTTAHRFDDDRIFYHQAQSLKNENNQVKIVSLFSDFSGELDGIEIDSKKIINQPISTKNNYFLKTIFNFRPDCIICSEPLAVVAASKYKGKAKIIYDVTEWYPSKRMVQQFSALGKIYHGVRFFGINIYAGFLADALIFGEYHKQFPLKLFFPIKKSILSTYFPNDQYITPRIKKISGNRITLCYTGKFTKEKGLQNFLNVILSLNKKRPDIETKILLIGSTENKEQEVDFAQLLESYSFKDIVIKKTVPFKEFSDAISNADLFFDLREMNFENNHSLPIKIFYYAASGKPVIYSDFKATRKAVDVSKFGYLVNPNDYESIAEKISNYIDHPELYALHAENARKLYVSMYNWAIIEPAFLDFVKQISNRRDQ